MWGWWRRKLLIQATLWFIDGLVKRSLGLCWDIGLGGNLTTIAVALKPNIEGNMEFLMRGTSFGIESLRHGHYIRADEKIWYKIAKNIIALPDLRLKFFGKGKENWLDEGVFVPARKHKRGKHVGEASASTSHVGEEGESQNAPRVRYLPKDGVNNMEAFQCKHGGSGRPCHDHPCLHHLRTITPDICL